MEKLVISALILGICSSASIYANSNNKSVRGAVTFHEVSMPGGMVRLPLDYLFPSGYDYSK